ncbi:hypothetical protein SprV_0401503800 [Sparganum proliferum]
MWRWIIPLLVNLFHVSVLNAAIGLCEIETDENGCNYINYNGDRVNLVDRDCLEVSIGEYNASTIDISNITRVIIIEGRRYKRVSFISFE